MTPSGPPRARSVTRGPRTVSVVVAASALACAPAAAPLDAPAHVGAPDAPVCGAPTPPDGAPYGTSVGRSFRPLTLESCDGSGPYDFYGEDFCDPSHRLTIFNIATVWCVPSQMETAAITPELVESYRSIGVRIVQVLVDGPTRGGGATLADCQDWIDRHRVTHVMLLDSGGERTGIFFPSGTIPTTVLVDERGIIRDYAAGVAIGTPELAAVIDAILSGP